MAQKEMLHSQEGLQIWRNPSNKMVVCRLHYTADPNKRSEEWLGEAKSGMAEGRFKKEYEIEWDALDGQKVFPEILTYRQQIVMPVDAVTFNSNQTFWAGYDHGMRNPAAFIVFTQDESGTLYAVWELYEPCINMLEFVAKMKKCPYWPKIKYIVADPALWDKRGYSSEGMPISPYEMFCQYGIRNFVKGNRHVEQNWLLLMKAYWGDKEDIQFKIMENCQCLIEEFEEARYPNMTEMMSQNKNVVETMVDKNNHAMDATKYWMTMHRKLQQGKTFTYKDVWKRWRV
jgi:hypothetical protein